MSEGSAVPDAVVLDAEATVENGGLVEIARRNLCKAGLLLRSGSERSAPAHVTPPWDEQRARFPSLGSLSQSATSSSGRESDGSAAERCPGRMGGARLERATSCL